jgi:hypothetical protein
MARIIRVGSAGDSDNLLRKQNLQPTSYLSAENLRVSVSQVMSNEKPALAHATDAYNAL